MKIVILAAACALAAAIAACSPAGQSADAACADDGARLAETGICQARAVAYLDIPEGAQEATLPDNCEWVVNETMLADEALLYRAARCGEVTSQLSASVGAQTAEVTVARSALGGGASSDNVVIRLFTASAEDSQFALRNVMSALPEAERAQCEIRPAGENFPAGALMIAPTEAARARMPQDEPIQACGPYGLDENSARYWAIRQGYAWFFDLGQDIPDFDPASVTVLTRQADGSWARKE